MHICFINTQRLEGFKLPKLFTIGGYIVYFWSNEDGEPIHVHISEGKPTPNATKIWLTKTGGCIIANNGSKIPSKDLNKLLEVISAQFFIICAKWKEFFVTDTIKFYCWSYFWTVYELLNKKTLILQRWYILVYISVNQGLFCDLWIKWLWGQRVSVIFQQKQRNFSRIK